VRNIEVEVEGAALASEIIVVGAHYDSVVGAVGANDNGSGVAAVLELARLFREAKPARTLRLVAFVDEELPFFKTNQMGSRVYARRSKERRENIVAMFSLETIGYYSDRPGSQRYPFPLGFFYPRPAISSRSCRTCLQRAAARGTRELRRRRVSLRKRGRPPSSREWTGPTTGRSGGKDGRR
jgi:Zn-dependent M28 family amino/carboxypeptidase